MVNFVVLVVLLLALLVALPVVTAIAVLAPVFGESPPAFRGNF